MTKTGIVLATYDGMGDLVAGKSIGIVGAVGTGRSTLALSLVATLIESVNENHVLVITDEYTTENVRKKVSENLLRSGVLPDGSLDASNPDGIIPVGKLTVLTSEAFANFEYLEDYVAKQEIDAIIIDGVFLPDNDKKTKILNHLEKFQVIASTQAVFTAYTIQGNDNRSMQGEGNKVTLQDVSDRTNHVFLTHSSNGKETVFEADF
jgi:predicted ATP-dependent serine protease